jgi:hypothetical protein
MWLDLNPGSPVKVVGHNIKGAKQPCQQHIGNNALGKVIRWNKRTMSVELWVRGSSMLLGH